MTSGIWNPRNDGFLYLRTPHHLLKKLEWEYENLQANPGDAWAAFNFFVTAEHMPDWCGCVPCKNVEPLLQVCSHIANGAKHFNLTNPKHKSVKSIGGPWRAGPPGDEKLALSPSEPRIFWHGIRTRLNIQQQAVHRKSRL